MGHYAMFGFTFRRLVWNLKLDCSHWLVSYPLLRLSWLKVGENWMKTPHRKSQSKLFCCGGKKHLVSPLNARQMDKYRLFSPLNARQTDKYPLFSPLNARQTDKYPLFSTMNARQTDKYHVFDFTCRSISLKLIGFFFSSETELLV